MRRLVPLTALVVMLAGAPARAVPGGMVMTVGFRFYPGDDACISIDGCRAPGPPLVVARGTDVVYVNLDFFAGHSLTSDGCLPSTAEPCRFDSGVKGFGQFGVVATSGIPPGEYGMFCILHPATMKGTLTVA